MQKLFILFLMLLSFGSFSYQAFSATIKVQSDFSSLRVGDVFTVDLAIDSEGQALNAFEAEIMFPADLLEYVSSDDGNSLVNLWIERPKYQDPNTIIFSGITPGGFNGKDSELLTLIFKVKKVGQGNIEVSQANLLRHDGLGTEAVVNKQNLHIAITEGRSEISVNIVDDEIPEHFNPEIIQDPDLFSGSHTLIFATEDKGSGIDRFEIKEGLFSRYHIAQSPYELKDQNLNRRISIKAIDKSGNERIEIIYPQNWQPWYEYTYIIVSILILCVLVLLIYRRVFLTLLKK